MELKQGRWFSFRYSLANKGNQLHHWIFLLICRTQHVGQPSVWEEYLLYTQPCISILLFSPLAHPDGAAAPWRLCKAWRSLSKCTLLSACCSSPDRNLKRMFLLYYKHCYQSKPGLCLRCFLLCEKKSFITDLSWSHLTVSFWAHFASNSIRTKNNSMDNLIADQ